MNDLYKENISTEPKARKGKNQPVVEDESKNLLTKWFNIKFNYKLFKCKISLILLITMKTKTKSKPKIINYKNLI